jgi:predicted MPP superfamily phosphohydrolase
VNTKAEEFDQRKDIFAQITAKDGCYSILWNHDYGEYTTWPDDDAKLENNLRIRQHHADIGWNLLLNSHVSLQKDDQHIALVGIQNRGDSFAQYGDLDEACHGIHPDEICILLSHDPSHRDKRVRYYTKHHIALTLSGHTHGMQFGIDQSRLQRSPIKYRYPFWIGLYEDAQRHLYVNRWFGVLGLNARVGMNPEITVIELKKV